MTCKLLSWRSGVMQIVVTSSKYAFRLLSSLFSYHKKVLNFALVICYFLHLVAVGDGRSGTPRDLDSLGQKKKEQEK